jgi:hypothetical protein
LPANDKYILEGEETSAFVGIALVFYNGFTVDYAYYVLDGDFVPLISVMENYYLKPKPLA